MKPIAPGVLGIAGRAVQDPAAALEQLLGDSDPRVTVERRSEPAEGWALARVTRDSQRLTPSGAPGSVVAFVHGDLYNLDELRSATGAAPDSSVDDVAAAAYRRMGGSAGRHFEGAFSIALVDRDARQVVLVSDRLGSHPMYWTVSRGTLIFASSVAAVLRHPGVSRRLDLHAVADYTTFGFPLGTKTLVEGVALVPAGSSLTFDLATDSVTVESYASVVEWFTASPPTRDEYFDRLGAAFTRAVSRSVSGATAVGLSLSGGLDSRAILSAIGDRASTIHTYTLGVKGCADEAIAQQLVDRVHSRHTFYELDDRYLRDFVANLDALVAYTDGMYLSHGLTEMLALRFLSESNHFGVLVRGHGGELAKSDLAWPLHTDDRIFAMTTTAEFAPYMLARANYISPGVNLAELFHERHADVVNDGARASLDAALAGIDLPPADLCSILYLNEHHRRMTNASLAVFQQVVDVRLPFVDNDFLRVLFSGRPEWRRDTAIHRALVAGGNPALLNVRNSNTGARVDAGPRSEWLFDKMNTVLKRLNVPGYRHYHNFQDWMSRQLLSSVDEVLLSPESLDRGILREAGVRRLLQDTKEGRADRSYLLQTLLILELWQRQQS